MATVMAYKLGSYLINVCPVPDEEKKKFDAIKLTILLKLEFCCTFKRTIVFLVGKIMQDYVRPCTEP